MPNSFSANVLDRQNRTLKLRSPVMASLGIPFEQEARSLADFGTYLEGMPTVFKCELEGHFSKTFNVGARAFAVHMIQEKGGEVLQMDFDMLATKASAQTGSYIGVDAGAYIFTCRVSYFDASLGAGVATGVGIRDGAIEAKI
ncbi:hypothetical protein C8R45DRAFT_1110324 [Mycena sanguinolenta]|nr:hypothetical protein C8R45DRAFT_1110324 [Mycena sanguinolenta]